MQYYLNTWKKFFDFKGRARRKEYWVFVLINMAIGISLTILPLIIYKPEAGRISNTMIPGLIFYIAMIIPTWAVVVRRLHDIGKSGAWMFITLVPFIGSLWLLVLLCTGGEHGPNQYGEDPKTEDQ